MAKRAKPLPLPPVGAAYGVPLANGLWGGCRVIRSGGNPDWPGKFDPSAVLIGLLAHVGPTPPTGREPGVATLMRLTRGKNDGDAMIWTFVSRRQPIPSTFVPIAAIPPTPEEATRTVLGLSGWPWIAGTILRQWRWDHDRDAVLREEAEGRVRAAEIEKVAAAERKRKLDVLTLTSLRAERPFAGWRGTHSAKLVAAARATFRTMIDGLIALGPKPTADASRPVLQACVERFNELDGQHDHFVDTIEREDICEHFARVVHAAGVAGHDAAVDLTEPWREW